MSSALFECDCLPNLCDGPRHINELCKRAVERLAPVVNRIKPASALDTQVGGNHYSKLAIQPMEYSMANKLDACQHTAIKYITRFRDKGGVADLDKAIHCIEMLKEFESRAK